MNKKFYPLLLSLSLLAPVALTAQVTTSGLTGFVKDQTNGAIPSAAITATHVPSGTVYTAETQDNGNFTIQGMRPGGPYTIEIEYFGLQPKRIENVYLVLGESFTLNEKLSEEKVEDLEGTVISSKVNPILNGNRTGAATNIDKEALTKLPSVSRSLTDFTRLTPQANGNSFAGRDGRYNNLQVDGANFNNGFGLNSNPLPGGDNQPISLDAIEAVQVNIAPYDVRQTGFTGAGINAVTRSGTNRFEGSAYSYTRAKSFSGLNVGNSTLSELDRTNSQIYGARVGAPIVKDKLFIFANFEHEKATSAGNNWIAARPGLTGANVTRVNYQDLEDVRNHLITNYGYDPGRYENYANNYANQNFKALARLDWNINKNNKFTLRYNLMEGTSQQGVNGNSGPNPRSSAQRIGSESITFENANFSFKNVVQSVTAELNSNFKNKLFNQLLATYSYIEDSRSTPGSIFPFVDIWQDGKNYMTFGTELFSYNNGVKNNNFTITDNVTYYKGKHTFTAGASFQTMSYGNSYMRMGTSYYRYNSVQDFLNGAAPSVYGVTYPYAGQDPYVKVQYGLAGVYLQDKISLNPKFNLTAGVRVDLPIFFNTPMGNSAVDTLTLLDRNGNPTTFNTAIWPKMKPLVSPRVGFNWDVLGDKSLQMRGGTGIFTGNIPFVWFTNLPTNLGINQATYEPVDPSVLDKITGLNADPYYWVNRLGSDFPANPAAKVPGALSLIDPNFKMPQVWRTNLGLDYKIANTPLIATVDVSYSKDINAVYQYNANRKAATETLNYSGDDRAFWNGANNARYNPNTGNITALLANTNKGYSFFATGGLTLSEYKGFNGGVFYTYSAAKDVSGNPGSAANSAWSNNYSINDPNEELLGFSQYALPHRVMANLSYKINYANHLSTTVSLFYNGSHRGRYAYTYNGDINKDGVSLDLLYIPNSSSELNFVDIKNGNDVVFTAEQQRQAYDEFLANDKILSKYKGDYVERNAGLLPWFNRFDVKLLQDIYVTQKGDGRKHTLQLSLDIMNFGNLLNKNWGVFQQLNNGSSYNYDLLKVTNVTADGVPSFNMITIKNEAGETVLPKTAFRNQNTIANTWSMQFGIRYIF